MLHSQLGFQGFSKPMKGYNVFFFFWDGMKQDVHTFVDEFYVCECNNGEIVKGLGTLQPLSIPPSIWRDIYMDFIVGLPKSRNK
jgi:hypothetical protein